MSVNNSSPFNTTLNKFGFNSKHTSSIKSGKVLSRYVKMNALFAMIFAVLGLWALQIVFSYLGELEELSDTYSYFDALKYILYRSPYFLEQFIPTGALLGAVVGLGLLANNSELIVMRAAGVSIYRIVIWVLQPAFIFVIIALAVNQFVLPHTNLKANQIHKPDAKLLASVSGYWTLQKSPPTTNIATNTATADGESDAANSQIIFIDYADANGNIGEVKRWSIDSNYNLTAVSKASGGTYLSKQQAFANSKSVNSVNSPITDDQQSQYKWRLNDVSTLKLADRAVIRLNASDGASNATVSNSAAYQSQSGTSSTSTKVQQSADIVSYNKPLVAKQNQASDIISLPIAPSSVYLLTRRAEDLSLTQLYEHKQFNDAQGARSLEHELALWQKLFSPLAILSLVIVACSFVFGSLRTHSLGLRIVVALLFGLLFSYMQDLTGFISLATGASPLFMVLLPIIGSTLLGLYLLKRQG